jgi:hypothetical protein
MNTELEAAAQPRVYTVEETARILRLSRAWIAVWKTQIPSLKIGKRVLVPAEAINKLLAGAA